jgi:tetratricopeptide (TPR) repeat protein
MNKPHPKNLIFNTSANMSLKNDIERLFQHGLGLLNQGRMDQAREVFNKVIKLNPNNADAHHISGIISAQLRDFKLADTQFEEAIKLNSNNPAFYCNRGNVLKELKQYENAINSYDQAIKLKSNYSLAYLNKSIVFFEFEQYEKALSSCKEAINTEANYAEAFNQQALILQKLKHFDEALKSIGKAIQIKNNYSEAYFNRGNIYAELEQFEVALENYEKAINIKPDYFEAHLKRGMVLDALKAFNEALICYEKAIKLKDDDSEVYFNQANSFTKLKRFKDAIVSYDKAISLNKNYAEAYSNRGTVLKELNYFTEALLSYDKAIELNEDYAEAHSNRGIVLNELKRFDEALMSYDRAIELKPNYAEAYSNRGILLQELRRFSEALESYDKAIDNAPLFSTYYYNKSILLLMLQDFEGGWKLYDRRWENSSLGLNRLDSTKPKHDDLHIYTDKKILVWAEQGLGDQILYAGMLDQLLDRAPLSQILLDKRLIPILRRSFPNGNFLDKDKIIDQIEHDAHLPIADLGKHFRRSTLDFDTSRNHYLKADRLEANSIRESLIGKNKFLCGINWSSKTENIGAEKSIHLLDLLPILSIQNITFVSLQYGNVQQQLIEFNKNNNTQIQQCSFVDNFYDIEGHSALIEACDFTVTISNTSTHISGAIGKKTYLMCPTGKGLLWYWANQTMGKSLWYPSINIYEQTIPGQWSDVVDKVKKAVEKNIYGIE